MRYVFGDYELDDQLYELRRAGVLVELERKVYDVLAYLIQQQDRLVTKDELLETLWPGQVVGEAALTRCITSARKALGDDGNRQEFIKTQHGRGYRFVASVTTPPPLSLESSVQGLESENHNSSPEAVRAPDSRRQTPDDSSDQTLDSRRQTLDVAAPTRSWLRRGLILATILLLVGVTVTVWYVSRPSPLSTQHSELGTEQAPPALALPDKPSIVVLPFVNLSEDPEQDYFSDGLIEDLTTDLAKISGLFVIARNSAFTYKGETRKVQEVGRELGVRYVLEGSIRKSDSQIRINTQLIDTTTGGHLWSERYDRPLQDIFALQDEIRQKIVFALKVKLTLEEQERFRQFPTTNLEAYDYFLRGREASVRAWNGYQKGANVQAHQMFEKAIALDPQYAAAYAQMGWTYHLDYFFLWSQDPIRSQEQSFALAQRAVALDDALAVTHWSLGNAYLFKRQHEQAITEMQRAIALNPSNAVLHLALGLTLVFAGQTEEGIGLMEQGMRLDPRNSVFYLQNLGWAYRSAGRCEEAIAPLRQVLNLTPAFIPSRVNLAVCYIELGRVEQARTEAAEVLRLDPHFSVEKAWRQENQPFKDPTVVLERLYTAARKAGLK